jgi:manganese transport protein
MVTAAFIGPGTVMTASRAGASFGFALLWTILFSVVATIVLQEMAARVGLITRQGLGEVVQSSFRSQGLRIVSAILIILAIGFGNAAYQAGNLTGAAVGLEVLSGWPLPVWVGIVSLASFGLLFSGMYTVIERGLIALVVVMSGVFIVTAVIVRPDVSAMLTGLFSPQIPTGGLATVIALIGTTIVPYNLFLHASSVRENWPAEIPFATALRESRRDTLAAVAIGGLITAAIATTAAVAFFGKDGFENAADMAQQLAPTLGGPAAKILFATGLLAAGMTSAVTAPLAAAYALSGVFGWPAELKSWRFRSIWMTVLACGMVVALTLRASPTEVILVAQVANGLLLPLMAAFLLIAVNNRERMGSHVNGLAANLLGGGIVLFVAVLAGYVLWDKLASVLGTH